MDTSNKFEGSCQDAIYSNEVSDLIIDTNEQEEIIEQSYTTICFQNVTSKYKMTYAYRKGKMPSLMNVPYRAIPNVYGLMDTSNLESAGVLKLRRLEYLNLLGTGTVVAIIDTGIDYLNPLFINADNTTRIGAIWDQETRSESLNEAVQYGTVYTKEDINRALSSKNPLEIIPEIDTVGHGTFLAGIIAGNIDIKNDFSGIAPMAEIVVVKLKGAKPYLRQFFRVPEGVQVYQENDIMLGIKFAIEYAKKEKKPISICVALGTNTGDHNGKSPFSNYMDDISRVSGLTVAIAGGNEGNSGHHYFGQLESKKTEDVELLVGEKDEMFIMELWASSPSQFSVELLTPNGETSGKLNVLTDTGTNQITYVLIPTKVEITYRAIETGTGDELIFFQFTKAIKGIWKIRVYNDFELKESFHIWLPITKFLSTNTYFLKPDPYVTLVDSATTANSTNVTYYNHVNQNVVATASRGFNRECLTNPDIAAPGIDIYGPIGRGKFGIKSGSSVGAAHIAGVNALLLEWSIVNGRRTTLDNLEAKTLLIKGAKREIDRTYPNREWGYGILDIFNTFDSLRNIEP